MSHRQFIKLAERKASYFTLDLFTVFNEKQNSLLWITDQHYTR